MGLDKNAKICLVLKSESDLDLFKTVLSQNGIKNLTGFTSSKLAYENATRTQYDLFIVALEVQDQPGTVFMQRLRDCGNYGLEPYLFVGDKVDSATLNLFAEHDIEYVITKPFSPEKIVNKLFFIFKEESSLNEAEAAYRGARSAFQTGLDDMALEMAKDAEEKHGLNDKFNVLIGDILMKQGEHLKARPYFEAALEMNQESLAAKHKLAATYMANKEFDKAKSILDQLADENPQHIKLLENAGLTNLEIGNLKKAKKIMGQVQGLDDTSKVASEVITKVKIEEGETSGLAASLSKTHSEQELVRMLNTAGVKLSKDNQIEEAIKIYEDCLQVITSPDYAGKVHYNIGLAYQKLGDTASTIEHLKKTIEFIPDMEKASNLLAKLSKKSA